LIITLFILAFALRLYAVIAPAIWYDEAFTLHIASLPVKEIITMQDFTPPLWEWELHPFVVLFPSVVTIRIAALVLAMLTLYIAYLITQELFFNREQTILALFIAATLPGLIWTGSDGRVYALFGFLYMLGIYAALTDRRALLFITSLLLMFIHATGLIYVTALYYFWFVENNRSAKEAIVTGLLLCLPWLAWYYPLLTRTGDGLFEPMTITYFISQWTMAHFIGTTQTTWLIGFFVLGLTIPFCSSPRDEDTTFPFMPIAFLVLASFFAVNLVTYRTLSPTLIPFALIVAKNYTGKWHQRIIALTWITLLAYSAGTYSFTAKGSQQTQAAQLINTRERIVYATITVALPFDYYLPNAESCILQTSPDGALIGDYDFGFERCTDLHAPYWFIIPDDPNIPTAARAQMDALASRGKLITEFTYPQISPVQVWRIEQ
jgi:hypothetical protein